MVVFNYDRCIEHYLFHAFQTYYGIRPQDAASLVAELAIYHPYGTVGQLPWQCVPGNAVIQFGADPGPQQLLNLSRQIKTFTEGTDPNSSEIVAIRKVMRDATKLVFLGFAFHPLNMKLLWDAETQTDGAKKCFATAKGISDSDLSIIKSHLANFGCIPSHEVQVRNALTCSGLFHEFWRSLAL